MSQTFANIHAEEFSVGLGTIIEPTAVIRGLQGKAKKIHLGDHCYIGHHVQIICDDFSLGDYSKIQHNTNIHGYLPCHIGHNLWMGQYSIVDSIGGMTIGNNCGVGAHSQLWSHIKYGDTLEGCRFLSEKEMKIGNDVWFVGHCIVSPIHAEDKSMALAGSVVTKDMLYNQIYSGSPAVSISHKIGYQFEEKSTEQKFEQLCSIFDQFKIKSKLSNPPVKIVMNKEEILDDENSYFVLADRAYTKFNRPEEIAFMKYLLPDKAKFIPY